MAKQLKFKVHNARQAGQYALVAADLAIGYEDENGFTGIVDVRGLFLKERTDGSGRFVSFPSKARIKDGVHQEDANGKKIYDNIVDLFMEVGANPEKADKRAPTKAAWAFKDYLTELMEEAYESLGEAPAARSAPKPVAAKAPAPKPLAAKKPAGAPTRIPTPVAADGEDGDDSLPF